MMGDGMNEALATIIAAVIGAWAGGAFANNKSSGFVIGLLIGAFLGFALSNLWNFFSPLKPDLSTPTATSVAVVPSPLSQPPINLTQGGDVKVEVSSTFQGSKKNGEEIDEFCYDARKAIDNDTNGDPNDEWGDICKEWVSQGESEGAMITIILPKPVLISYIELYDRPNTRDQIRAGEIQFDNGNPITVKALPDHGVKPLTIQVEKVVQKITFRVTEVKDDRYNIGLAEIKVIGPSFQP